MIKTHKNNKDHVKYNHIIWFGLVFGSSERYLNMKIALESRRHKARNILALFPCYRGSFIIFFVVDVIVVMDENIPVRSMHYSFVLYFYVAMETSCDDKVKVIRLFPFVTEN